MNKENLINEIINFCFDYDVIVDQADLRKRIEEKLNEAHFIENLINTIYIKSKNSQNIDLEKVKELLIELEKIRLELEYSEV